MCVLYFTLTFSFHGSAWSILTGGLVLWALLLKYRNVREPEVGYLLFNGPNELVSAQNIVIVES